MYKIIEDYVRQLTGLHDLKVTEVTHELKKGQSIYNVVAYPEQKGKIYLEISILSLLNFAYDRGNKQREESPPDVIAGTARQTKGTNYPS